MKKVVILFAMIMATIILSHISVLAQTPPDCQEVPGCEWGIIGDGQKTISLNEGCELVVTWEFRQCPPNNIPEFRITGWTVVGDNCPYYSSRTLKEIAFVGILEGFGDPTTPLCGNGTKTTVHIFTGICVYEQRCTYTYPAAPTIVCDPTSSTPPEPAVSVRETVRHLPCGSICCKTIFEVCRVEVPDQPGNFYVKATQIGASIPFGTCDPPPAGSANQCQPICNY